MNAPAAVQRREAEGASADRGLIVIAALLFGFGLVMMASASMHMNVDKDGTTHPFYFVTRQAVALAIGTLAGWVILRVRMTTWRRLGPWLYVVGLLMLVVVLLPGVGREANGAVRWIATPGFNLQPSEFMKFALVLYLAGYLVRRREVVASSIRGFIYPMALVVIAGVLIMLEPDFGTTAILLMTAMGMLFLGGVPLWQFGILAGSALAAMVGLVLVASYRLKRVTSFLDPWSDAQGAGYQLTQALIGFGRGEWFGVGLGEGIQKRYYLPEAHTDFLMAVVGEELGFIGTLFVIGMFTFVVLRAFRVAATAERRGDRFSAFVAKGFGLWIGLQALINIGVNVGMLPTKGLTLPFMSYGGNSIIVACMVIATLLRIDYENRQPRVDTKDEEAEDPWAQA